MRITKNSAWIGENGNPGYEYQFQISTPFGEREYLIYQDVVNDKWFGEIVDSDSWHDLDPSELTRFVAIIKDAVTKGEL